MAGYCGYSMSNNAVEAYSMGLKPLSKWTKGEILSELRELVSDDVFNAMAKWSLKTLKSECLSREEWHHTSKVYNRTSFYSVCYSNVDFEEYTQKENRKAFYKENKGIILPLYDNKGVLHERAKMIDSMFFFDEKENEKILKEVEKTKERILNKYPFLSCLLNGNWEISSSGNIYKKGRKPNRLDYENLDSYWREGDIKIANVDYGYLVYCFNNGVLIHKGTLLTEQMESILYSDYPNYFIKAYRLDDERYIKGGSDV